MDSKKTQKIIVVILVVTALLGIIGAILVYYLSTEDRTGLFGPDRKMVEEKEYCACITAYTTATCNDCSCTQIETQTLEAQIGEIIDGVCSLDCDVTSAPSEEPEQMINCLIPNVKGDSCHSVSVRDIDTRDLIIPPIRTERPIIITVNFVPKYFGEQQEEFTKFSFIINGERTELNANEVPTTVINGKETYIPELEFSNFQDIDTLTIQATSSSDKEFADGTPGRYCYKQYDLYQQRGPFCSGLVAYTQEGTRPNSTVVNRLEMRTPNLRRNSDIEIEFNFNHRDIANVRTNTIPQSLLEEMLVNETIFLEYQDLYSTPTLFVNETGFPALDSTALNASTIRITAQLYVDNTPVDSNLCGENLDLLSSGDDTRIDDGRGEVRDDDEDDYIRDDDEDDEDIVRPDLELIMEGPSCVRKAPDENSVSRTNYRITIRNNSDTTQEIEAIRNKLPLGFRYIENTTSINRVLVSDNIQEITSVGESQDILWSNNWEIQPDTALVLEYGVNVTNRALDGENQNEAVATPINIPEDMSRLRAEVVTLVSDECVHEEDLPETGNLTFLSFATGILVLIFGILIYQGRIGVVDQTILKLINARIVKKNLLPKEYFEESILEKEEERKD